MDKKTIDKLKDKREHYKTMYETIGVELTQVNGCTNMGDTIMAATHTVRREHYRELIELTNILI